MTHGGAAARAWCGERHRGIALATSGQGVVWGPSGEGDAATGKEECDADGQRVGVVDNGAGESMSLPKTLIVNWGGWREGP